MDINFYSLSYVFLHLAVEAVGGGGATVFGGLTSCVSLSSVLTG